MNLQTCALLGILLTALACSPGPVAKTPTARNPAAMSNLFPLRDGAEWKFQNPATGATLTIDWTRFARSFCGSNGYPLYLSTWTKSDPANYWEPGTSVTLYQLYYDDGQWVRSNAWWSNTNGSWYMQDMVPTGVQAAYPIMLDSFSAAGSVDAPYIERAAHQQPQRECLPESDNVQPVAWTTKFYRSVVDTPAYSGPVIQSEQIEGCTPAVTFCNHEIWSFAPNIGLVEIQDLSGYGVNGPPIVNVRVPDAAPAS